MTIAEILVAGLILLGLVSLLRPIQKALEHRIFTFLKPLRKKKEKPVIVINRENE